MLDVLTTTFDRIGLKEKDRAIYLACLRSAAGLHVQEVADRTRIRRSTVNLVLDRLERRGFVSHHVEGRRKIFTADPPERILRQLEDTLTEFRGLIPLLLASRGPEKKARVRFFQGVTELPKLFDDILLTARLAKASHKREILAMSSARDIFAILPQHEKQFIEKRVRYAVPLRWIAPESTTGRAYARRGQAEYRRMKFFDDKKYLFRIEIDIYGDSVAVLGLTEPPAGVIIEDASISESFRSLFNLLWDSL